MTGHPWTSMSIKVLVQRWSTFYGPMCGHRLRNCEEVCPELHNLLIVTAHHVPALSHRAITAMPFQEQEHCRREHTPVWMTRRLFSLSNATAGTASRCNFHGCKRCNSVPPPSPSSVCLVGEGVSIFEILVIARIESESCGRWRERRVQ